MDLCYPHAFGKSLSAPCMRESHLWSSPGAQASCGALEPWSSAVLERWSLGPWNLGALKLVQRKEPAAGREHVFKARTDRLDGQLTSHSTQAIDPGCTCIHSCLNALLERAA
jgi:hypothetical protein